MSNSGHKAAIPNPALKPLGSLVGEWQSTGTHHMLPGVSLSGKTSFEWIEGGAFLLMRSSSDDQRIPAGMAIFGSDNTKGEYFMLYFDEREVSRKCDVSVEGNVWRWERSGPEFTQRYTYTVSADAKTMTGKGEMSKDGGKTWEPDLNLTYRRIQVRRNSFL